MDINQDTLNLLYRAVNTAFDKGSKLYKPYWEQIASLSLSTSGEESYSWLGEFSRLREWIGDRQIQQMKIYDYSIKNIKYEATEGVPAEYIEDDRYGVLMPKFEDMGYAAASHPDELIFDLLAKGFETKCYDGKNFFDAEHPVGEVGPGTVVSNMQDGDSSPWFLLDTSRPLKPMIFQRRRDYRLLSKTDPQTDNHVFMRDEFLYGVDARVNAGFGFWQMAFGSKDILSEANFDLAMSSMMSLKSDKGRKLGIKPTLLVVGPNNRAAAKRIVKSEKDAGGGSNVNFNEVDLAVVPWLD